MIKLFLTTKARKEKVLKNEALEENKLPTPKKISKSEIIGLNKDYSTYRKAI